jgi:glycosyltransferase involved in cell wall biosynthesis
MNKNHTLGVIVPIYNEEKYLKESINRLLEVGIFSQIILVDDNSTDSSFEIANSFAKEHYKLLQ